MRKRLRLRRQTKQPWYLRRALKRQYTRLLRRLAKRELRQIILEDAA